MIPLIQLSSFNAILSVLFAQYKLFSFLCHFLSIKGTGSYGAKWLVSLNNKKHID